jgi:hypothetical protein
MTTQREGLLDKIRGLLAKTIENGCTESEALAALAKARAMMDAYAVGDDELDLTKEEKAILRREPPGTKDPLQPPSRNFASARRGAIAIIPLFSVVCGRMRSLPHGCSTHWPHSCRPKSLTTLWAQSQREEIAARPLPVSYGAAQNALVNALTNCASSQRRWPRRTRKHLLLSRTRPLRPS